MCVLALTLLEWLESDSGWELATFNTDQAENDQAKKNCEIVVL